jgi:hypothetical protein
MMNFRRANHTRLDPKLAKRQGDISRLAFQHLGRERAIAFLNTDDAALGGRPLELATTSDAGFADVEARLERLAADGGKR